MTTNTPFKGPDLGILFADVCKTFLASAASASADSKSVAALNLFRSELASARSEAAAGKKEQRERLSAAVQPCVQSAWAVLLFSRTVYMDAAMSFAESSLCGLVEDVMKAVVEYCPGPMADDLKKGSALLDMAVEAVAKAKVAEGDHATVTRLLEWWGDEICEKKWGVAEIWTGTRKIREFTALTHAAGSGNLPLIVLLVRRGAPIDGNAYNRGLPLQNAFQHHQLAAFVRLLELGASIEGLELRRQDYELKTESRVKPMLESLVAARPSALLADFRPPVHTPYNFLDAAMSWGHAALVAAAFDAGALIRCRKEKLVSIDGKERAFDATLAVALKYRCFPVIRRLVTEGKALEGWQTKYVDKDMDAMARSLVREVALHAYGPRPCRDSLEVLNSFLDGPEPFNRSWAYGGGNTVIQGLLREDVSGWTVSQETAIAVLKRFRAAGFNVISLKKKDADAGQIGFNLLAMAARMNAPLILDYAHSIGIPVDETWPVVNPQENFKGTASALNLAIKYKQPLSIVRALLTKYKAKAAYPELGVVDQPIFELLCYSSRYTDEEALPVLEALIDRDPKLLDLPCFMNRRGRLNTPDDPVGICTISNKPKCFEALLRRVPSARSIVENASYPYLGHPMGGWIGSGMDMGMGIGGPMGMGMGMGMFGLMSSGDPSGSLAQSCANTAEWKFLELILRYTNASVVESQDMSVASVSRIVQSAVALGDDPPPRALAATVAAKAQAENDALKRMIERGKAARDAASKPKQANTFEDPSYSSSGASAASTTTPAAAGASASAGMSAAGGTAASALTHAEARAKEKKKAAKKKARAKKRAAAKQANAGAGGGAGDAEGGSEDEDEGLEELDDNLVDSRNAPSVDVMFAAMGLGPGGAPKQPEGGATSDGKQ